jgi:hypothetical protein
MVPMVDRILAFATKLSSQRFARAQTERHPFDPVLTPDFSPSSHGHCQTCLWPLGSLGCPPRGKPPTLGPSRCHLRGSNSISATLSVRECSMWLPNPAMSVNELQAPAAGGCPPKPTGPNLALPWERQGSVLQARGCRWQMPSQSCMPGLGPSVCALHFQASFFSTSLGTK